MAFKWIEAHAHLVKNFSYKELDKFAEDSNCEQIWIHALDHVKVDPKLCGSREVLEAAKHYPNFIKPFAYCLPDKGPDQVKRFKDEGFCGLKFLVPANNYDDPENFPVYAEAAKLGMPCFFHVGIISQHQSKELSDPRQLTTPCRMKPSMLDTIAAEFPDLRIIAGHPGVPWCNEMYESLWFYPNIKCTICGLIDYKWLLDALGGRACNGEPFYEKFMFATDAFYGVDSAEEYIRERVTFFKVLFDEAGKTRLWGPHAEEFMYRNAKKIFDK